MIKFRPILRKRLVEAFYIYKSTAHVDKMNEEITQIEFEQMQNIKNEIILKIMAKKEYDMLSCMKHYLAIWSYNCRTSMIQEFLITNRFRQIENLLVNKLRQIGMNGLIE